MLLEYKEFFSKLILLVNVLHGGEVDGGCMFKRISSIIMILPINL